MIYIVTSCTIYWFVFVGCEKLHFRGYWSSWYVWNLQTRLRKKMYFGENWQLWFTCIYKFHKNWCSTNNNESTIMKIIRYLIYWLHRYAFLYFIVYISLWMKFASVIIFPKIKIYSVFLTVGETSNIVPWKLYKSTTCSCILPNKSTYNQIKKKNSSTLKKGITWVSNSNHQLQY